MFSVVEKVEQYTLKMHNSEDKHNCVCLERKVTETTLIYNAIEIGRRKARIPKMEDTEVQNPKQSKPHSEFLRYHYIKSLFKYKLKDDYLQQKNA